MCNKFRQKTGTRCCYRAKTSGISASSISKMASEPPAKLDYKSRRLVGQIVEHVKSQGMFDQFRRDCIEELEQKESYRQLKQRVESHVATFLSKQTWTDALPKNQVRNSLRKHINQSEVLERGIKQLISQALDTKSKVFQTRIEGVVQNYIYTQNNPQRQEKQNRKHKTTDEKDEAKSSSSDTKHDVISDISQLIPIPGPSNTVTKASDSADKKLGAQDTLKSSTSSKGFQTTKKQGKSNTLTGRGEETRTASPVNEKSQSDESSKAKEGKSRISRVKTESFSRDDGRVSPKIEENSPKLNKLSRVKVESANRGESSALSSVEDKSNLSVQETKTSSSEEISGNPSQVHLSPATEEMSVTQGSVRSLVEVKKEKDIESERYISVENKIKVKEEKSETIAPNEENEQKEKVKLEPVARQESQSVSLNEVSQIDTGAERSDIYQTANNVEEMPQVQSGIEDEASCDLTEVADESKDQVGVERTELAIKNESQMDKVEGIDDRGDEKTTSARGGVQDHSTSEHSGIKSTDLQATQIDIEKVSEALPSETALEASDEIQRQPLQEQSQDFPSCLEDHPVGSEPSVDKFSSVSSSLAKEDVSELSSVGDYSDGESDISEVSSVHTSDLSSFDGEVSSVSESYDEVDEERRDAAEKREHGADDDREKTSMPESQQDPNAPARRRSTRISSRRSTKEGESEISENESSIKESRDSSRKRRRSEKKRNKNPASVEGQGTHSLERPRRRGRPRKDERRTSDNQIRRSRTHDREDSSTARERSGGESRESRSTRSQRRIKRTRCYSPSSEGTREVFLPRKRSRDDPL